MKISVIVPTYHGLALLQEHLPRVLADLESTGFEHEVLVVEDGSHDGTEAWAQANRPEIQVVQLAENRGFGGACAAGFAAATGDAVLLLNNDVSPQPGCTQALVDALIANPDAFAVSPRVIHPGEGDRDLGVTGIRLVNGWLANTFGRLTGAVDPVPILYASGGAALMRRQVLTQLEGFDPLFHPFYFEDVDLSYRAWKRGHRVLLVPTAAVHHVSGATIGRLNSAGRVSRVMARNKLLFQWKNLTDPGPRQAFLARLPLRLVRSIFRAGPPYFRGFLGALPHLRAASRGYRRECRETTVSDAAVAEAIGAAQAAAGVVIDD